MVCPKTLSLGPAPIARAAQGQKPLLIDEF